MGILERIVEIERKIAEQERRNRNRRRTGTIAEVDYEKGVYRVKLGESDGKPYLTGWIKSRPMGAGAVKFDILHNVGDQVDVVSENGDLTDARIEMADYSEANARENTTTPLHIKIGSAVFAMSDGKIDIIGDVTITGSLRASDGVFEHNEVDVGSTHKHIEVMTGPDESGPPAS